MIETVWGPLAAVVGTLVAISFGVGSFRDRPVPVRVPVRARSRRHTQG